MNLTQSKDQTSARKLSCRSMPVANAPEDPVVPFEIDDT